MQTLDATGQPCNVLHQGEVFSIIIHYRIDNAVNNLELACSITDKAGQLITGQRFPELGQSLQRLEGGTSFSCRFQFKGSLQPGLYFVNAGAWNCQKNYLHHIIDGCAIHVGTKDNIWLWSCRPKQQTSELKIWRQLYKHSNAIDYSFSHT